MLKSGLRTTSPSESRIKIESPHSFLLELLSRMDGLPCAVIQAHVDRVGLDVSPAYIEATATCIKSRLWRNVSCGLPHEETGSEQLVLRRLIVESGEEWRKNLST